MTRSEPTERILSRKRLSGLTWREIAARIGNGSPILVTAALLGQMRLAPEQAARAAELLGLGRGGAAAALIQLAAVAKVP